MKHSLTRRHAVLGLAGAAALTLLPLPAEQHAAAHEAKHGTLTLDHPWSRPTIPNRPSAAYMTIINEGTEDDRLIAASSIAFERIELHETREKDGVMTMFHAEDGILAPAGGKAVLEPGGYHLMLFGAVEPLTEGMIFPMILSFEKAGDLGVGVLVTPGKGGDAKEMDHSGHDGHGDHSSHSTN